MICCRRRRRVTQVRSGGGGHLTCVGESVRFRREKNESARCGLDGFFFQKYFSHS